MTVHRHFVGFVVLTLSFAWVNSLHAQSSSTHSPARAEARRPASPAARALFQEPRPLAKGIELVGKRLGDDEGAASDHVESGFYPELSNMITGAGWISAGPGYRQWLFDDRILLDGSAAISWRAYKMAQARVEAPRLLAGRVTVGSQVRWQDLTQVTYFGHGRDSLVDHRSEYRLTSTNVVGYASVAPRPWLSIDANVGWLGGPTLRAPAGTFRRGHPYTREVFPADPVFDLAEQPDYLHGGLAVTADTRDAPGHPTRGGLYRAAWAAYDDRATHRFGFQRYELEGAQFVPAGSLVVLALRGWLVASDVGGGGSVPFYLQPSLGGANTLRSFTNYRFHDNHLLLVNTEARLALFEHVDLAAFIDAGNVAARVADLNLDKVSYGTGVRVHWRGSTIARLDIARGEEGWQVLFRTNDLLRSSRLTRRTAAVPFAP